MNRKYDWWDLPDDPNRVGDEDYRPTSHRRELNEDEEYERERERNDRDNNQGK